MKRLFMNLGISSILVIFWFCSGYILSLFFNWSIHFALVLAGLAFIVAMFWLSIFGNDPLEKYR